MTQLTAQDVLDALRNPAVAFTDAQIRQGFEILQTRHRQLQALAVHNFKAGDQVEFDHKGKALRGVVTKVNQKTVAVKVDWQNWKVAPTLLREAAAA